MNIDEHVFKALDAERDAYQKTWRKERRILWFWHVLAAIGFLGWLVNGRSRLPWGAIVNLSFALAATIVYRRRNRERRLRQIRLRLRPQDHELAVVFREP